MYLKAPLVGGSNRPFSPLRTSQKNAPKSVSGAGSGRADDSLEGSGAELFQSLGKAAARKGGRVWGGDGRWEEKRCELFF